MTRGPDNKRFLGRRTFLATLPLIPGALAQIACNPFWDTKGSATEEDKKLFDSFQTNEEVITELKKRLGVTPVTTRNDYEQRMVTLANQSPHFMEGIRITAINDAGEKIPYSIDDTGPGRGEGRYLFPLKYKSNYPQPAFVDRALFLYGNNKYLAVYGPADTVARSRQNKEQYREFIEQYFGDINSPAVLHVVFVNPFRDFGLTNIDNSYMVSLRQTMGGSSTAVKNGVILRSDVQVNIPLIHAVSANTGIALDRQLTGTLVNEMTDQLVLKNLQPKSSTPVKTPESIGTIATTIAQHDEQFARLVLGGTAYIQFTQAMTQEAQRIGTTHPV